jgi:hypothetical protein
VHALFYRTTNSIFFSTTLSIAISEIADRRGTVVFSPVPGETRVTNA